MIKTKKPNQFFEFGQSRQRKGNKYKPGPRITTMQQFEECAEKGRWVFWHGRVKHPVILENQQYRVLRELIKGGHLHEAVLNQPKGE
jgi:hypothetical protein